MWAVQIDLSGPDIASQRAACPENPDLILLFADQERLDAQDLTAELQEAFPAVPLLGCTAGLAIRNRDLVAGGAVATAIGFDKSHIAIKTAPLPDAQASFAAGAMLGEALNAPDLVGVILLSEGVAVDGTKLVRGLQSVLGENALIGGGLASGEQLLSPTRIIAGDGLQPKRVAALGLYGTALHIAQGCAGRWDEFGPIRRVTRSDGPVILEIDNRPALDLYEAYLEDEAENLPQSGLFFPLAIWDDSRPQEQVVRTLTAIDREARSITVGGDVPEGWRVRLMRGYFESLIEGAGEAVAHARAAMRAGNVAPQFCLMISCTGRHLLMGQRTAEEVETIARELGDAIPVAGFYSNGELAPNNGSSRCELHNQTVTLALFGEAP